MDTIRYYDIETDYRPFPQVTMPGWLGPSYYIFWGHISLLIWGEGGQIAFLRWLSLFRDFEESQKADWGQACLAYLYFSLDTLSGWTLRQLM